MAGKDYTVYRDDLAFSQDDAQNGVLLSRLEGKLMEIRSYHINWESYHQGQMISQADYQFVSHYDRQPEEAKKKLFEDNPEKCIMTLLSLIGHVAKEHVIQYSLVMLDDILAKSKDRVKQVHDVALKNDLNIWPILVTLLNRDDSIVMHMASRLITKLATLSRYRCPDSDLIYFLNWLKVQLCSPGNEYLQSVAKCIQLLMRIDDYRMPFVKADGINSIVSVLLSNLGFQLQYQLIFCIWMLSFQPEIAAKVGENNVIPILADILRNSQKEKVTRIIIHTFKNLLEKPENCKTACVSLIQSKLVPVLNVLSSKTWTDEDIKDDIEYVSEKLQDSVQDLSTWDEYVAEVKSGRLEWSPVHKQEKFWRENAIKICEKNYELLKVLVKLLEYSTDPLIQAVACHDLGEFIRHYPRARPAFDALGCKELVMLRMTHEDEQVKYEALLAVQKLLVHNWEFLGKQVKVE
ncbi:V-type proton ATPase subunit H-like [Hydractinia symbiolongicarpus]|uniref:V-type proton ATPase subunit H-like n=1 Tax=Hydractinia symbiolongicarpus TaxID=13093 RepID=UPI00254B868F|nr:V-type proton ATPase subunit H-like [Hydractinia symbiolongicarpus]